MFEWAEGYFNFMGGKMRMRLAGLAISLAVCMTPAFAASAETEPVIDCGAPLSSELHSFLGKVRGKQATLAQALTVYDNAATKCPENAFALHYAALAHLTQATELNKTPPIDVNAVLAEWHKAFDFSTAYWELENRDQSFRIVNGIGYDEVRLPYEETTRMRDDLVTGLLNFHARYNLPQAYISGETWPQACTDAIRMDVSAAFGWLINNKPGGDVALSFAEGLAALCPMAADNKPLYKSLSLIQFSVAEAKVADDPEGTRAIVERIKTFRDFVLENGETSNFYWDDYEAGRLGRIETALPAVINVPTETADPLVSAGPVPVEKWFQDGADEMKVRESMGRTFNAYVAARGVQGFVSAMGKMFVVAKNSPDPKSAYQQLYQASYWYGDKGSWRSADTKDVEIFSGAYKWLKDYEDKPADAQ